MKKFEDFQNAHQTAWRKSNVKNQEYGYQNGSRKPWILPKDLWEEGLWPGIRTGKEHSLSEYLKKNHIQKHSGVHNLKSSWVLTANLYYAHRHAPQALTEFLANRIDGRIVEVIDLELEWTGVGSLSPSMLLGERNGNRGANQTSPDIAFIVKLRGGSKGIVLTEVKFTEHSFYGCSGRDKKNGIADATKCLRAGEIFDDPDKNCYLANWKEKKGTENRRYWEYIKISEQGREDLNYCPAATAGYQLFRQQAYAEAIVRQREYELVVNCVAFDDRNKRLVHSLRGTGVDNFTENWDVMFEGKTVFKAFTHQDWMNWVRESDYRALLKTPKMASISTGILEFDRN